MLKTIELCEGCEKEYRVGFKTDDDVWLCANCTVELLKAENARLDERYNEAEKEANRRRDEFEVSVGRIIALEVRLAKFRDYAFEQIGVEHVPIEFGGKLE